ncbi:MAG: DegV family protein [Oscillospiraceae bacterium]|nr:DegV family protein [Oscillospiraceae bacterium]
MKIRITSDSTCDLDSGWLKEHQVEILPLYTIKGGQTFRDGVDIHPEDIFAHVAAGGDLCSTAANNAADYAGFFSRLLADSDAIIHINISAEFSSCYQNACLAATAFENVFVVDSRNLSTGHGLVVCEAVKMAEAGVLSPDEIAAALKELTNRVEASFLLDRLDYMRKGGRCSAVAALGANLLKLKPCIEVENGSMHVAKKYRGNFKKCILEYVHDRLANRDDLVYERIFITHTPVEDGLVEAVRQEIQSIAPFTEILETSAGCTISCHCGPSTLGILFIRSK